MAPIKLTPSREHLSQEYLLVQAWKKAHDYIRSHNWYSDVLELDLTNADLENRIHAIVDELNSGNGLHSDPLRLVLAPKSQAWDVKNKEWVPEQGPSSVEERLRPLAHLSVRDQIVSTAFMILFADVIETLQGDPRMTSLKAREKKMVSYGHRLLCDVEDQVLHYRWGSSVVYRQYFQDYQAFVSRPQEVVVATFGESKDWAVIYADLSQFYDRVRPEALCSKIERIFDIVRDDGLLQMFRTFFNWSWHSADQEEVNNYAKKTKPYPIEGFDQVALPQGLVASGFFANAYMIDFDSAVCREFDKWQADNSWQLIDYCRYVDDMRIVVRLSETMQGLKHSEISEQVCNKFNEWLATNSSGLLLNREKCSAVLGRESAAGSIRVSESMKRINHNTSGAMDLFTGEETIDLIEGLFFSRLEEPIIFEDKFQDTFFAAKPDVRDETVARFSANRFRRTYRAIRPMCEDSSASAGGTLSPTITKDVLDNKAIHFCRRLIERWVRDPSNMRLLRVAVDIFPDEKALELVLELLKQFVDGNAKRKAPRRVAWYCAAEILKAGATETGLVTDVDCLPSGVDLSKYQQKLKDFALLIIDRRNAYPWYLEQQAYLFLACSGHYVNRRIHPGTSNYLKDYLRLHHALAGRSDNLRREDVVPFSLLEKNIKGHDSAARTFLTRFREEKTPTQRKLLIRIFQEDATLAEAIQHEMTEEEQEAWSYLYQAHGILSTGGFPATKETVPTSDTSYSLLAVARSDINPFQQEYAALHFAVALLKCLDSLRGLLFPTRIKIHAKNWQALFSDRFPIEGDNISIEFDNQQEDDVRYALPTWVSEESSWKYQLGQILRVLLTGIPDFTAPVQRPKRKRSLVLYLSYRSSWLRRRYGLFNGRNAFGPPSMPISSWFGSLLARLLEWPGFPRSNYDFELKEDFDKADILHLLSERIKQLEGYYGKSSRTPMLPVKTPKALTRSSITGGDDSQQNLNIFRVGVVQTVIPRTSDFTAADPELNSPPVRRYHRRHLSAVLGGVHRMLQVRETHKTNGSGIELLVFPELSIHLLDLKSHIEPFVLQHRCIVFAGMVFHRPRPGDIRLINSGYWIIPVRSPFGGYRIEYVEQGKWNLTNEEKGLGISPFRPAQWILDFVNPSNSEALWSISGSICYDSTDLLLAADLRDLTQMFVVPALNKDVGTFDNMVAALHYHMFQHVIVANSGQYGGSTGQAPFEQRHERTIFHTHGNEQVTLSFFDVDFNTYRGNGERLKTPPAGLRRTL